MTAHHFVIDVLFEGLFHRRKEAVLREGFRLIGRRGARRRRGLAAGRRAGERAGLAD